MGVLTDRIGARRTALIGLAATTVPLLLGWLWVDELPAAPAGRPAAGRGRGELRGGAADGQPLVSAASTRGWCWGSPARATAARRWRPSSAPGWSPWSAGGAVFGLALIPVAIVVPGLRRARPGRPRRSRRRSGSATTPTSLGLRDAWWFCIFYAVTFGGFVGLTSLPVDLLPRPVRRRTPIQAGNVRDRLRRGRLAPAAARRLPRRSLRRHPRSWWGSTSGLGVRDGLTMACSRPCRPPRSTCS